MKAKKEWFIFRSRARDYRFFAADQSRGTKKSCLRARDAAGEDKQRKLPF